MIRNDRTGEVLASSHRVLTNLWQQATGLMLRPKLEDEGWVFAMHRTDRWDITNLLVFQTIDVLWLDEHRRVLQVRTVKPWTPHVRGAPNSRYFIELPAGRARRVRPGDGVSWLSGESESI